MIKKEGENSILDTLPFFPTEWIEKHWTCLIDINKFGEKISVKGDVSKNLEPQKQYQVAESHGSVVIMVLKMAFFGLSLIAVSSPQNGGC